MGKLAAGVRPPVEGGTSEPSIAEAAEAKDKLRFLPDEKDRSNSSLLSSMNASSFSLSFSSSSTGIGNGSGEGF